MANSGGESVLASELENSSNCYRVYINGKDVGLVASREDAEAAIKAAISNLAADLGYDPDVKPEIRYYEEFSEDGGVDASSLIPQMENLIKDGIDVIKVKAYAMKIGDDLVVSLASEEEVLQVLKNVETKYVSDPSIFDVTLDASPYNSLVQIPAITMVQEPLAEKSLQSTSSTGGTTDTAVDPKSNGTTIGAQFSKEIMVAETYVAQDSIQSVEEATGEITKENVAPKTYTVQEGDSASLIAQVNNMATAELYSMNPGLETGEFSLQIGDELNVMVPEAELSVTTIEETTYTEVIARETTYVDDPEVYIGEEVVTESGSDGEKTVAARLTKINGVLSSSTIISETVTLEPVNQVVAKGTKELPPKHATGNFVMPVSSYRFTSGFGYRWGTLHAGVDLAASTGTKIFASDGGTVVYAGWYYGYGYLVEIDHGNGYTTRYGHCSSISVSEGQKVGQYEEIARVGNTGNSTGSHCHFEIRSNGTPLDPMDFVN